MRAIWFYFQLIKTVYKHGPATSYTKPKDLPPSSDGWLWKLCFLGFLLLATREELKMGSGELFIFIIAILHTTSSNWAIIGPDNGLLPSRHQAIIWTNVDLLSTGFLETNYSEISIKTQQFLSRKIILISKCCLHNVSHFVLASMQYFIMKTQQK